MFTPFHLLCLKYSDFSRRGSLEGRVFYCNKEFMKITWESIKECKQRGEWAELRFMTCASEHGLCVSKPWGDSSRYDFVVEHAGRLMRVQVKSTTFERRHSYICHIHASRQQPYTSKQIDFVAAYIIPKNIWFIFPIEALLRASCDLTLSPHLKDSKYAQYQEAWHLMRGEPLDEKEIGRSEGSVPPLAES